MGSGESVSAANGSNAECLLRFTNTATDRLYMSAMPLFRMEYVNGVRLNVCVRLFCLLKPESVELIRVEYDCEVLIREVIS